MTILAQTIRGLFRMHTVYDEMVVLYRMAQVFPWNERTIKRSEHLHFVWLMFVNLCYSFEERFKLAANAHNKALKDFGVVGGIDIKSGIKKIRENLKEHIRKRGEQTHEWRKTDDAVDNYSIVELAKSVGKMPEVADLKVVYGYSQTILSIDISKAIAFMETFLLDIMKAHSKEVLPISRKLNAHLKRLKKTINKIVA